MLPLSLETLSEAIALTNSVFPDAAALRWPEIAYKASLGIEPELTEIRENGTDFCQYWTQGSGTIGLYHLQEEPANKLWLGWFCVHRSARGKGLGRQLLEFAISEAHNRGCKELWLYTSRDPDESIAQILYEKLDFKLIREEVDTPYNTLYRKKDL